MDESIKKKREDILRENAELINRFSIDFMKRDCGVDKSVKREFLQAFVEVVGIFKDLRTFQPPLNHIVEVEYEDGLFIIWDEYNLINRTVQTRMLDKHKCTWIHPENPIVHEPKPFF